MNAQDLLYDFPEAAYLIVILIPIGWLFWKLFHYKKEKLSGFAHKEILNRLTIPESEISYWIKAFGLGLIWLLAVLALMQPMGFGRYQASEKKFSGKQRPPQEVILFLDASASMNVADMSDARTRFSVSKDLAEGIVSRLTGQSVAVYAFTSEVTQLAPLTTDYLFVHEMLREIHINEGGIPGTSLSKVMNEVQQTYFKQSSAIFKTVVLLTDGGDTDVEALQGTQRVEAENKLINMLEDSPQHHLQLYAIGLGTQKGMTVPEITYQGKPVVSVLEEALLKSLSEKGNGRFFLANDFITLNLADQIVSSINQVAEENAKQQSASASSEDLIHTRFYQFFLGLAILFLAFVILIPDTLWIRKKR